MFPRILLSKLVILFCFLGVGMSLPCLVNAEDTDQRLERLENRLKWLEQDTRVTKTKLERVEELARNYAPTLFLFAGFCALWAQNTRRNAVLWFFLGLIFNFVAVLVVLAKNGPEAANR